MKNAQPRVSWLKGQRNSSTQWSRRIFPGTLLLALAASWTAVTPAAEWVRLTPQGQWKQGPTVDSTGSSDAMAVQVAGGYAYVADASYGLQVIDVRNPIDLQRVGGYATGGIAWNLTLRDSLVYVADLNAGMVVIDVSNPSEPQRVGGYPVGALGIALQGTYAYAACTNGVHVLDITDPKNPRRVGSCAVPGQAYAIAVSGAYAYLVDFDAGLLVVVGITNASAPQVIGTYQTGSNPTDIALAGGQAFVAGGTSGLSIWDITDPAAVKLVGKWTDECIIGRVAASSNLVYLTAGVCFQDTVTPAVRVLDVEHPASPVRVGGSDGIGLRGLIRSGNYLYVADEYQGLRVVGLTELPAFTGASVANGYLSLSWNRAASGFTLQRAGGLDGTGWQDVPNSAATNSIVLPLTEPSQVYRLRMQSPAGLQLLNTNEELY